jgi:hypothetical protein
MEWVEWWVIGIVDTFCAHLFCPSLVCYVDVLRTREVILQLQELLSSDKTFF